MPLDDRSLLKSGLSVANVRSRLPTRTGNEAETDPFGMVTVDLATDPKPGRSALQERLYQNMIGWFEHAIARPTARHYATDGLRSEQIEARLWASMNGVRMYSVCEIYNVLHGSHVASVNPLLARTILPIFRERFPDLAGLTKDKMYFLEPESGNGWIAPYLAIPLLDPSFGANFRATETIEGAAYDWPSSNLGLGRQDTGRRGLLVGPRHWTDRINRIVTHPTIRTDLDSMLALGMGQSAFDLAVQSLAFIPDQRCNRCNRIYWWPPDYNNHDCITGALRVKRPRSPDGRVK